MITHHGAVRDAWPHLATRLGAYLRRRGVSLHDTEDIVQECALRVLSREVPFTDADDLMSWCLTVARNAHVDLHRGQGRLSAESVPDRPAGGDVHEEVASRVRLQAVVDAWPRLSPADQRVLIEAVEEVPAPTVRRDAVRLYVQRNRARQRLHALTAALVGILLALGRPVRRQVLPLTTLTAAAAVACLVLAPSPQVDPPAVRLVPDQHMTQADVDASQPRLLVAPRHEPTPAVAAAYAGTVTPPSTRVVAGAQGPAGYGAQVSSHERTDSPPTLVCIGDLPLAPDTCVPDAPRGVTFPVR